MLENDFYPTPRGVIEQMLAPYRKIYEYGDYKSCKFFTTPPYLDPQGGSGAILDYLRDELLVPVKDLYTIEIQRELRMILQSKGYRVLHDNFLTYDDQPSAFGLIAANPPFAEGVKHALKAWDLLADFGHMVCLLNAETLRSLHTKERKLLLRTIARAAGMEIDSAGDRAIEAGTAPPGLLEELEVAGAIEFLGQAFKDSERPTDVEIALIRLRKPRRKGGEEIDFEGIGFQVEEELGNPEFAANPLAHNDAIKNLVVRYQTAQQILFDREAQQAKLRFFLQGIEEPDYEETRRTDAESLIQGTPLADQLRALKARFWATVFTRTKIGGRCTSGFRKKFQEFSRVQSSMAFSEQNIKDLLEMFFLNRSQIMSDCLVEVFDEATAYHEKNVIHTEGWKTNKSYRLNKRIIMPQGVRFDEYGCGHFETALGIKDFLNDIDKILCWLSGTPFEEGVKSYSELELRCNSLRGAQMKDYAAPFSSYFFQMRIYKKGTLHLDFLDLELLNKFNRAAAEGKNWIGGGY